MCNTTADTVLKTYTCNGLDVFDISKHALQEIVRRGIIIETQERILVCKGELAESFGTFLPVESCRSCRDGKFMDYTCTTIEACMGIV